MRMHYPLLALTAGLAVGCAGTPDRNIALEEARSAYTSAANNPQIMQNAPVEMERAQNALTTAERLNADRADRVWVDHNAYLARQRVELARATTQLSLAEQAIKNASAERDRVLLANRTQQADAARARADQNAQAADAARQQAATQAQQAEQARLAALEANAAQAATAQERADKLRAEIAQLQAQQTERGLVLTLGDVLFDVDKAQLKPGAEPTVEKLASFLQQYPQRKVMIEGFTDSTGAAEYNQQLSRLRADAVRAALLRRGIDSARVEIRGYGEADPVATNDTAAGRQQNRRVEVVISDESGRIQARAL